MITAEDMEAMGYEYYVPEEPTPPYKPVYAMVKEFQKVTGQVPTPALYLKLFAEEMQEFNEALQDILDLTNKGTLGETAEESLSAWAKESADMIYVLYGLFDTLGINLDEVVKTVHENNVGRCIQPDGSVQRREDGKVLKNPNYPKLTVKDLVRNFSDKHKEAFLRLAKL